jgi:hypothetical protein
MGSRTKITKSIGKKARSINSVLHNDSFVNGLLQAISFRKQNIISLAIFFFLNGDCGSSICPLPVRDAKPGY